MQPYFNRRPTLDRSVLANCRNLQLFNDMRDLRFFAVFPGVGIALAF
jgi:hypothetical protein